MLEIKELTPFPFSDGTLAEDGELPFSWAFWEPGYQVECYKCTYVYTFGQTFTMGCEENDHNALCRISDEKCSRECSDEIW